jgi:hypothetical protein
MAHQELETNIVGVTVNNPGLCSLVAPNTLGAGDTCEVSTQKIKQDWDDWDLFQVGGIIFF